MQWRTWFVLVSILGGGGLASASDAVGTDDAQPKLESVSLADADPAEEPVLARATVDPAAPAPSAAEPDLSRVQWTVCETTEVHRLAKLWGMPTDRLLMLNPALGGPDATVEAGTKVLVFVHDPAEPVESIGAPNRGRLANGLPMPEGRYWRLRDHRHRTYGTEGTVRALLQAFNAYGQVHPDGQPIHVGELSRRRGGRVFPHVSHRSGRDVDIGYIMKPGTLGDRHWRRADESTLDVERTWTLISALGDTGKVQRIFISSRLQRLLRAHAAKVESPEVVAKYFRTPGAGPKQRYLITHENGHRDHLHVRFRCDPEDRRCRGHGLFGDPRLESPVAVGRAATASP